MFDRNRNVDVHSRGIRKPQSRLSMVCAAALCWACAVAPATGQDELRVYFGNLHAHSNASDGNKNTSPADAFRIAREQGGLDFLSLSEHNHIMADQATYDGVIAAADAATTNGFVALFGQEFSTIKKGFNHANIQNYPLRIPPTLNGQYGQVFGSVIPLYVASHPDAIIVGEFNHPDNFDTDYGLRADFGGDINAFVRSMDPFVQLIAVASGPADANKKSFVPSGSQRFVHQNISTDRWFQYLSHGMHLAPKIDHDTHSPSYGFRHAGRTAVWAHGGLTREKLLGALASRHCYATEDKNLRILPTLESGHLPGDILLANGTAPLTVGLAVTDEDEPQANYIIEVYSGVTGDGMTPSRVADLTTSRTGNGAVNLALPALADAEMYYVLHVQQSSKDPVNESKVDDAWLAPIWVSGTNNQNDNITDDGPIDDEIAPQEFVSSRNSDVYHFPDCRVVAAIKPTNLQHHVGPPEGKHLHQGCPLH